jgi:hypothetical protein
MWLINTNGNAANALAMVHTKLVMRNTHAEFEFGGSTNRQTDECGKVSDHNGLGEIEESARTGEKRDQSRHVHKKGQFG